MTKTANGWEERFGAKRRAADKALLQTLEAQIAAEEANPPSAGEKPAHGLPWTSEDAAAAIARAFGRSPSVLKPKTR